MVDVKISDMTPSTGVLADDLFETSHTAGPTTVSSTGQQIADFTLNQAIKQLVYDNSPTGDVTLTAGKPIVYNSNEAGFRLPSMTETEFDAIPIPDSGLMGWADDLDRVRINKGTPGAPIYDNLAYISDIASITEDGAIGECFFSDNATETVISVIGTPVQVAGTYLPGELFNISHINGRLTNDSSETLVLRVSVSMTCSLDLFPAEIKGHVFKNGSASLNFEQDISLDGVSHSFKTVVLTGFVTLSPADFIEVFVSNETNTNNITVKSINFNCNTIGGTGADGGNITLGTCLIPTQTYINNNYETVIQTLSGTQTIAANTLEIGQSVELIMGFDINPIIPTSPSISGNFRYTFGSIVIESIVNDIIITNSSNRLGELRYTITRIDAGNVEITVVGSFTDTSVSYRALYPSSDLLPGGPTYAYDPNVDALIDVEWRPTGGDASNVLNVVARNLRIVKFS